MAERPEVRNPTIEAYTRLGRPRETLGGSILNLGIELNSGHNPGFIVLIVPSPDEISRIGLSDNPIRKLRIEGVSVRALMKALVGLGELEEQSDGSVRFPETHTGNNSIPPST